MNDHLRIGELVFSGSFRYLRTSFRSRVVLTSDWWGQKLRLVSFRKWNFLAQFLRDYFCVCVPLELESKCLLRMHDTVWSGAVRCSPNHGVLWIKKQILEMHLAPFTHVTPNWQHFARHLWLNRDWLTDKTASLASKQNMSQKNQRVHVEATQKIAFSA